MLLPIEHVLLRVHFIIRNVCNNVVKVGFCEIKLIKKISEQGKAVGTTHTASP